MGAYSSSFVPFRLPNVIHKNIPGCLSLFILTRKKYLHILVFLVPSARLYFQSVHINLSPPSLSTSDEGDVIERRGQMLWAIAAQKRDNAYYRTLQ